ncbi:MAG: PorT family protein [candidate division KSB1 bacterium]|nr:PorT family protein [candidate division KSB1 bacterium]
MRCRIGARLVGCLIGLFSGIVIGSAVLAQAGGRFAMEANIGHSWASHWSPRDKPPGTQVVVGWQPGLMVSASTTADLGRWLTAELGIVLTEKGAHHTVTTFSFPFGAMELTYRFRYLEVPVLFKTYWLKVGPGRIFTYGGGYVAAAWAARYTFYNEQKGGASRTLTDVERGDVGFVSGFGCELPLGKIALVVKYRYSMGFVDLTLDTDPVHIAEFHGVDFPVILLRNFSHAVMTGVRYRLR